MKWFSATLAWLIVLSIASANAAAAESLTSQLPDDLQVVMVVRDVTTISPRWQAGALGRAGADPQMQKFLAPIQESFKELFGEDAAEEGAVTFEDFLEPLSGMLALVIPDIERLDNDVEMPEGVDSLDGVLFLADVGDADALRSVMVRNASFQQEHSEDEHSLRVSEEEFLGKMLSNQEWLNEEGETIASIVWSIVGEQLLFGDPVLVRTHLERIHNGVDRAFSDRSEMRSLMSNAPNADIWISVAIDKIIPALIQAAEEEAAAEAAAAATAAAEAGEGEPGEEQVMPSGPFADIKPQVVFEALGLDALEGAAMAITFEPAETSIDMVVTYSENRGLIKVMAYKPGPVDYPKFIPAHAYEAAVVNFSFAEMWQGVREIFVAFEPGMIEMFDAQLAQMKEATGFDLEKNLIDSLGDTLFVASFLPEDDRPGEGGGDAGDLSKVQQVVGLAVEDTEAFDAGLGTLVALLSQAGPGFREVEYLDSVFYEMIQPQVESSENGAEETPPPESVAFSHAGGYLLISSNGTEPLRAILARMSEPGKSIWQEKKVKDGLKYLSEDAAAVSVSSTFELGQLMLNGFMEGLAAAGDEEDSMVDPDNLPEAETFAKYFNTAVNGVYKTDSELRIVWKLLSTE
jgi:hypothetical protein